MRMRVLSLMTVAVALGALPADAFWGKAETKTESGNADMGLGEYKGLKHAIGCKDFTNDAGWHGRWELGRNLTAMLESALYDSGRFVIVEREQLGDVLQEQDLAAGGRAASAKNAARRGVIRPAKYIASGSVTEVSEGQSGGNAGVNTPFGRVGGRASQAQISLIVKLIDTTTGEIVAKERIVGKAGRSGLSLSNLRIPGTSTTLDLGGFKETPIGQAAQDCIVQAAKYIAQQMEEFPFEGSVIQVDNRGRVLVNRGSEFGMVSGQRLAMRTEGEQIIDPDTGAILGTTDGESIGTLQVTQVADKFSYCKVVEGNSSPARGTQVVAASE
jgi:curli biogenesis system outer membrane secretion channel CsgG